MEINDRHKSDTSLKFKYMEEHSERRKQYVENERKFILELLGECVLNLYNAGESPHRARFPCNERQNVWAKKELRDRLGQTSLVTRGNGI